MGADSPNEFGRRLQQAREHAGLTREQLAGRVGLDTSHLFRIEKGGRSPSSDSALALAVALELDDLAVNQLLVAAGFAPIPALGAVRESIRARGTVRTRGAARGLPPSSRDASERAKRLEMIGLTEANIARVLDAMSRTSLALQDNVGRALSAAFAQAVGILESPVRTAVIPAAGGIHRLLADHVMQQLILKSMHEAVHAGIRRIVLVLAPSGAESLFEPIKRALELSTPLIEVDCCVQATPNGLGAAVLLARSQVGSEAFAVLLPDDFVRETVGGVRARELKRMLRASAGAPNASLVAVSSVSRTLLRHSGAAHLAAKSIGDRVYPIVAVVEKPGPDSPIAAARRVRGIVGRYVLHPDVFSSLAELAARGVRSLELTDGLALWMTAGGRLLAYEIDTKRTDVGAALNEAQGLIEGI